MRGLGNRAVRNSNFFSGAVFGVAISGSILLCFMWMADGIPDKWFRQATEIVTVFATILAALVALKGVYAGIESAEEARQSERRAKLEAAVSTLPLVLSQLVSVTENRVLVLTAGAAVKPQNAWTLDELSLQVFKECIEYSDQEIADLLQEILAAYQICVARFETRNNVLPIDDPSLSAYAKRQRYEQCSDWISLKYLADNLFGYSRNRQRPVDRKEVFIKTQIALNWLSLNGWMLSNDNVFQQYLAGVARLGKAGFSDQNWRWT